MLVSVREPVQQVLVSVPVFSMLYSKREVPFLPLVGKETKHCLLRDTACFVFSITTGGNACYLEIDRKKEPFVFPPQLNSLQGGKMSKNLDSGP